VVGQREGQGRRRMAEKKKDELGLEDWNTIRVCLECVDLDGASAEFTREVEDLYAKLQRMGLI
jgi:hypothetical protein